MKILIVDDSIDTRLLMAAMIEQYFDDVLVTQYDPLSQGRPGDDFAWHRFDAVLLDYELGRGDNGLQWLEFLRDTPELPPVILVTGEGDEYVPRQQH